MVDTTSGTSLTVTLHSNAQTALTTILNKIGSLSTGDTRYHVAAAKDWAVGTDATLVMADLSGNSISVTNVGIGTTGVGAAITSEVRSTSISLLTASNTTTTAPDNLTGLPQSQLISVRFAQDSILSPKSITGFGLGRDTIDLLSATGAPLAAPASFSRAANNASATSLEALATAVFTDTNGAIAGNQALAANAAVLVTSTNNAITGTYILINDATTALDNSSDILNNITGFTGNLPAFGNIATCSIFV